MHTKPLTFSSAIPEEAAPSAGALMHRRPLIYLAGLLLLTLLVGVIIWQRVMPAPAQYGMVLQSPQRATDFALASSTGGTLRLSDFRGQYLLLNFGYTSCPDVCPLMLANLAQLEAELGAQAENVQVLFVSVDPARDTPDRLTTYLSAFSPSFLGATGDEAELAAATTQFGVYYQRRQSGESENYFIDHTASVVVIDPEGYVRLFFPNGTTGAQMATDLKGMMRW